MNIAIVPFTIVLKVNMRHVSRHNYGTFKCECMPGFEMNEETKGCEGEKAMWARS